MPNVFIATNMDFPIDFSVKGGVFINQHHKKIMISFKENMYMNGASFDGKTWLKSHKLLNVETSGSFTT